jgi:hypothetical protein
MRGFWKRLDPTTQGVIQGLAWFWGIIIVWGS